MNGAVRPTVPRKARRRVSLATCRSSTRSVERLRSSFPAGPTSEAMITSPAGPS